MSTVDDLEAKLDQLQSLGAVGIKLAFQEGFFHGTSTLREIELVGRAGLSAMDAIAAATRIPARMLGLADEIGTVEVGKRADLVIVRDDPLVDLRALRTVLWTVKDGVAHTPVEWMGAASTAAVPLAAGQS